MPRLTKRPPPDPLASLRSSITPTENAPSFTPREKQVLRLTFAGKSHQATADALCIGVRTVNFHIGHCYAKLDVRSRMQALCRIVELGMFPAIIGEDGGVK
jgi:DNA-binding CsgD family transcriptional regulator